jgi:hypothetical protein
MGMQMIGNNYSIEVFGLFAGLVGLAMSYFFSQGMWLPFTWVFLAFNIAAIQEGLKGKQGLNQ